MIALGSNVASTTLSSGGLVKAAFSAVENDSVRLVSASRLYATPCVPEGAGPDYVNAVAVVETDLSAEALLARLHEIEKEFERRREGRWASRTLDLDLLDHGGHVAPNLETWQQWHDLPFEQQKTLFPDCMILPHPRIQDRAFVLVPLVEIAPDWRHPVLRRSARELLAELTEDQLAGIRAI
ncbi:2-amino-4-hydroxy-6-hydroxymethyldihydropteridine diphosphokinase [Aliiruegeria lutimaris]|uniref:2-amino-4-hydroxy-6- hydroxymethyldihydropteridine diphosphokinase n=1 Tax=Aliiruegeria lutimaris TaxID=571298 RepID=UPI000B88962B|nr:2-amino-4-hydroxy-6-hydroxymethyldihydropteridine diphosphokinase [Aliiruegeria lutimaris]